MLGKRADCGSPGAAAAPLGQLEVAPPAGRRDRVKWAPPVTPFGPVGVILARLWRAGGCWPKPD
eukprot:9521165-Lingulodinium_polyedra.AAC.1